jgi:hypothetical protein
MASIVIRNADWVIGWDEQAGRHIYRRNIDIAFTDVPSTPSFSVRSGQILMLMKSSNQSSCADSFRASTSFVPENRGWPARRPAMTIRTARFLGGGDCHAQTRPA